MFLPAACVVGLLYSGRREGLAAMVNIAIRATSHVAAWIVWHSMRVSLLDDLEAPAPPDVQA
ncbi:MAG: hypothetical protein JOZ25_01795 [Actinobacteria bacterium]|nr:hypothetical protein [Actinomycetota bacterium]